MNEDNIQMLYLAFPALYRDQRGFDCGDGWTQLIHNLSSKIEAEARKQRLVPTSNAWPLAVNVTKLNGTLRFYLSTSPADDLTGLTRPVVGPEYQTLIDEAEKHSASICERCGQPGTLHDESEESTRVACDYCESLSMYWQDGFKEFEDEINSEHIRFSH